MNPRDRNQGPIESPFTIRYVWPKAPSLVSLQYDLSSQDVSPQSGGSTQLAGWYFELIFVDFETLDFRIERSCRQP
jgi:hypothetical protein